MLGYTSFVKISCFFLTVTLKNDSLPCCFTATLCVFLSQNGRADALLGCERAVDEGNVFLWSSVAHLFKQFREVVAHLSKTTVLIIRNKTEKWTRTGGF